MQRSVNFRKDVLLDDATETVTSDRVICRSASKDPTICCLRFSAMYPPYEEAMWTIFAAGSVQIAGGESEVDFLVDHFGVVLTGYI